MDFAAALLAARQHVHDRVLDERAEDEHEARRHPHVDRLGERHRRHSAHVHRALRRDGFVVVVVEWWWWLCSGFLVVVVAVLSSLSSLNGGGCGGGGDCAVDLLSLSLSGGPGCATDLLSLMASLSSLSPDGYARLL